MYFPTPSVCSCLRSVYLAALRLNSWSLTLPLLERTKQQGGVSLPQPRTYLLWQHASAFVSYVVAPDRFRGAVGDHFRKWASDHGVAVTPERLPWFQLAVVPMASASFLASFARAFSLLRQSFPPLLPADCVSCSWPAWHTVAYRDQHGHAYYSPSPVRKGVLRLSQLRSLDSFSRCLPPTWVPRYSAALAPSTITGEFDQDLVRGWNTTPTLRVLVTASSVQERVREDTWGFLNGLRFPGVLRDFLRAALWRKLPVGDRIAAWIPHARCCPLCGDVETHSHAVSACPHLSVASGLVSCLLPKPEVNGVARSVTELVLHHVPLSVSSAAGLVFWSAISVNCSIRCAASLNGSAQVPEAVFLRKWLEGLRSWSGAPPRYLPESELVLFERALRSRVEGSPLVHPRVLNPGLQLQGALPVIPSFSPGTPRLKPNAATLRARFVLTIEPFLLAGWVAVYLDGSSELVRGVRIGGFGVCSDASLSFSSPLHVHDLRRISGRSCGLLCGHFGVTSQASGRCFAQTAIWCFGGSRGGAAQWKQHGWRNASGPVSHVDIWEEVLGLCLRFVGEVCWLKVRAHCVVPGNEDADTLANERRLDSPLYLPPLAAGGVLRSSDEDEGVCQAHDMVEDFSILEQVEGLESVEDCLNYDSDSDGGGGMGKGRYRGRDPAPPLLCTRGTFGPQCRCRRAPRLCPAWRARP